MDTQRLRPAWILAVVLSAVVPGACDRSPMDGSDLDMSALETLAGDSDAGRSVVSDLITIATELQAQDDPVPDVAIPTLEHLFDGALAMEAENHGPETAVEIRTAHVLLLDSAWSQIGQGAAGVGDELLNEAREFQASTAARVLGRQTSIAYVFLIGRTLDRVNEGLVQLSRQGVEVRRFVRMAASARDLIADARVALGQGETAAALDVGTHAAGLVNSLIREIHDR